MASRSMWRQISRTSHQVSRFSGDMAAAGRGPGVYAKRVARRSLTRSLFRLFG